MAGPKTHLRSRPCLPPHTGRQVPARLFAGLLTALLLICCLPTALAADSAQVTGSADVVITALSASHSDGADADISPDGESRAVLQASLPSPGAWACFELTVENRGSAAAVLSQVLQQDSTPDNILVSFGISEQDAGELLKPGGQCTVSIVVQLDPEETGSSLSGTGAFSLTLVYDAAGGQAGPLPAPKTGDSVPFTAALLALAASAAGIILLRKQRRV